MPSNPSSAAMEVDLLELASMESEVAKLVQVEVDLFELPSMEVEVSEHALVEVEVEVEVLMLVVDGGGGGRARATPRARACLWASPPREPTSEKKTPR